MATRSSDRRAAWRRFRPVLGETTHDVAALVASFGGGDAGGGVFVVVIVVVVLVVVG